MTACRILSYAVTSDDHYGMSRAVTRCDAHNWTLDGPIGVGDLCPIGRIEHATGEADASIRKLAEEVCSRIRSMANIRTR